MLYSHIRNYKLKKEEKVNIGSGGGSCGAMAKETNIQRFVRARHGSGHGHGHEALAAPRRLIR